MEAIACSTLGDYNPNRNHNNGIALILYKETHAMHTKCTCTHAHFIQCANLAVKKDSVTYLDFNF